MFIKHFANLTKEDALIAGGKGASLGEMTQAGIPVPEGFVILSQAFEHFVQTNELAADIDSILHSVKTEEVHTVENASEKIQSLILNSKIPQEIEKEISSQFKILNSPFVAVRSSATAEDSASAAWAGQLESYLNTTKENLLENVKKCWASLFTPRAVFYRFEKNLHSQSISVAVVVQKMIQSEKSGIAFSVHPVTQDRNQLIIEAGFGLGEAIVSGQITPDSYVVEKDSLKIIEKTVHAQGRGLFRKESGGNEWQSISKERGEKQVLTDDEILELSRLIIKIENHYGFPCDIEFAQENGKNYVVQSRPITTLLSINTQTSSSDKFISALEGQELFPPIHNSSLFVQTSGWNTEKYYGKHYADKMPFPLLITVKEKEGVMFIPATKAKRLSEETFRLFWGNETTLAIRLKEYEQQTEIIDDIYEKVVSQNFIGQEEFSNLTHFAESIKNAVWEMNTLAFFSIYFDKEMCSALLKELNSVIDHTRIDLIWDKGTTPISESFERRRERHLIQLLDRELSWTDIALRCQYFGANYNKISSHADVEKELKEKFIRFENLEERKRYSAAKDVEKEKRVSEYNVWLGSLTTDEKRLIRYLQTIIELRDARKDYIAKFLVVVFRLAQKLFREVEVDEDLIYFYMFDEIIKGKDYLLKNKDNLLRRVSGCTVFVQYSGTLEIENDTFETTKSRMEQFFLGQQSNKTDSKTIKGQVGSPGKIRGTVKVIMNLNQESEKFNTGDVLVTGMTRPEFVPLMKKAVAVITDEGGITCHAAIVSRELGIPCVIGTKIATRLLKDGDLIEVDANNGEVKILTTEKKQ